MKNKIIVLNSAFLLYSLILGYIYYLNGGIFLKAATGFGFILLGITNALFAIRKMPEKKNFALFVMAGLFACFGGDVIINYNFIIGALIFAFGHVFYLIAYNDLNWFSLKNTLTSVLIFIISACFISFYPKFVFVPELMRYVCIFYALIISFMLGKAVSDCIVNKNMLYNLIAAGSIAFFVSDIALLFYIFGNGGDFANTICLITYFPAQCILGFSIFEYSR